MAESFNLSAVLNAAVTAHQSGRFDAARDAYRKVLAVDPTNANALHLYGVIARRYGVGVDALEWITRAWLIDTNLEGLMVNLENAVHDAIDTVNPKIADGEVDTSAIALSRLVAKMPPHKTVLRILGAVRFIQGRYDDSKRLLAQTNAMAGSDEVSGLGIALASMAEHDRDYGFVGTVVVPGFNISPYVVKALDSIVAAVAYARRNGRDPAFKVHINVVDDCSTDDTVDVVRAWGKANPLQSLTLLHNNINRGAGFSRNAGAAAAQGRYIWYLDGDDYFFENHLLITAQCLDDRPQVGYVRTGIEFDTINDKITPEWREASEFTYPCNMAVRREVHDFVGGFPQETPFGKAGPEDVAYSRAVFTMFVGAKTATPTVFYTMRPGNILEKLHREMQHDAGAPARDDTIEARYFAVEILIRRRLYDLDHRRQPIGWDGPPIMEDRRQRVIHF